MREGCSVPTARELASYHAIAKVANLTGSFRARGRGAAISSSASRQMLRAAIGARSFAIASPQRIV